MFADKDLKIAAQVVYSYMTGEILFFPEQWIGEGEEARSEPLRISGRILERLCAKIDAPHLMGEFEAARLQSEAAAKHFNDTLTTFQKIAEARGFMVERDGTHMVITDPEESTPPEEKPVPF